MIRMSRRSSSRSLIGLILEIGFIALVVTILPKLNLRPQAPASPASAWNQPAAPASEASWWQADPAARATSWRADQPQPVNVEQTLQNASRQLLGSATDYASRTAQELLAEPNPSLPKTPAPHDWRRY
jgi:hypothetical protein